MSEPRSVTIKSVIIEPVAGGCRVQLNGEKLVNYHLAYDGGKSNYPTLWPQDRFFTSIHGAVGYVEQMWRHCSGLPHQAETNEERGDV